MKQDRQWHQDPGYAGISQRQEQYVRPVLQDTSDMIGATDRAYLSVIPWIASCRISAWRREVHRLPRRKKILYQQSRRYPKSDQELSTIEEILQGLQFVVRN